MRSWLKSLTRRALAWAGVPLQDPGLLAFLGAPPTSSGVPVTEATALNYSAVWRAVSLLSGTVAMLPRSVVGADGRVSVSHPVYKLLARQPNDAETPFVFWQAMQADVELHGNCYAEIVRERGLTPRALNRIHPDDVEPKSVAGGRRVYLVRGREKPVLGEDMIHIPGPGFDGLRGRSRIRLARESIGLGLAAEQYAAGFYGRGSVPCGVLSHPGELNEEATKRLRASWDAIHSGVDGSHRVAILEEGMSFAPISVPPADAEVLASRQFQVVEIARWFGVPPHLLQDLTQATYSNIEHQSIDFLTFSVTPRLCPIEQELLSKLFLDSERGHFSVVHDVSPLLRTDTKTRYETHKIGRDGGWLTVNDVLRRESMPEHTGPGGDELLLPANTVTIGRSAATPLDLVSMSAAVEVIRGLRPLARVTAQAILAEALPDASPTLITGTLDRLMADGTVQ